VFRHFLARLAADQNIAGDLFWELASHAAGHGWQPIPANELCRPTCQGFVEDGSWWALYYTGRPTASNTAADMAARAQIIRSHTYAIDGFGHLPGHELPPPPVITSTQGGHVLFEGSAGARMYSIQKLVRGRWTTPCNHCTTDNDDGWQDPAARAGCYRAIAYNLAGARSAASVAAGNGCGSRRLHNPFARARESDPHWVTSWSSPPVMPGPLAAAVALYAGTGGHTVRDVVHATLPGHKLRVRLSNVFGSRTATFDDVRVAVRSHGASIVPGTSHQLRFRGRTRATIAAGRQLTSDPVSLSVHAGEDLAISIYASGPTGEVTTAGSLNHTNYLSGSRDVAAAVDGSAFTTSSPAWYWLGGVDVVPSSPGAGAVVALGDSITAGYASTNNANLGWVDLLADRLGAAHTTRALAVLNAGIAGNNLHESSPCYGQSALQRLNRDVFGQAGVRDVIVDEGANDITHPHEPLTAPLYQCLAHRKISASGMIALFKLAIRRIHAHHLKVIGVTISPFGRYQYWTSAIEAERDQINHWIRTGHAFDGVIDFDAVLRDRAHRTWLNPDYDSGDHLHPNNSGHAAMARSIRLSLFR
jgi:lysophospholipase L1-like esterase